MASVSANILLILYMKRAHIVGVKGGEMRKCSREIMKERRKKKFKKLPPPSLRAFPPSEARYINSFFVIV